MEQRIFSSGPRLLARLGAALVIAIALPAHAQVMIIGNDEKVEWDDKGKMLHKAPGSDTLGIYDLTSARVKPKLLTALKLESSIMGPPTNLAVHPSGEIALVASSVTQIRDGETGWKPQSDTKVYVIDLKANPPALLSTVEVAKKPSGLAISKKGDLALVTSRDDNAVSVLSISGKVVKLVENVPVGDSVSAIAITPDGKRALAAKSTANKIAVLDIDGQKVTYNKVDLPVGTFPYNVVITPNGKLAIVNNNGGNGNADGNTDTASIIDLEANPPRVIDYVTLGDGPEGIAISPKGDIAVVALLSSAVKKVQGGLVVLKIDGKKVTKLPGLTDVGLLPEGIAFTPDAKHLYVGDFIGGELFIFRVEGTKLVKEKRSKLEGHPASLCVSPN